MVAKNEPKSFSPIASSISIEATFVNVPSTSRKSWTRISTRSASPASATRRRARSAWAGERVIPVTRAPYSPAATRAREPQPQPISSTWSSGPSSSFSQTSRSLRRCASASGSSSRSKTAHEYVIVSSRKSEKSSLPRS